MASPFDNRTSGQGFYDHPEALTCKPAVSVYDFSAATENLTSSDIVKLANLPPQSLVRITVVVTTAETGGASTLGFGDGTTATLFLTTLDFAALTKSTSPIVRMAQSAPVLTITADSAGTGVGILYVVVEVWPEPTAPTQVAQS